MLLEDASSRSLSSVDFGRAAQDAASNPKGIALPPPTEFIHAPNDILDAESALIAARREKSSVRWRIGVRLQRIGELAKTFARKLVDLMPMRGRASDELPLVEISREIDLAADDDADTARNPTPVPFPAAKRNIKEQQAPKRKNAKQWEVTTQVVDMGTRKKGKGTRPNSTIPVSDLTLDEE